MVSLDRTPVREDGTVRCPLRDARVRVAACVACRRLIRTDDRVPPTYVVCDARAVTGWLGLDSP